MEDLFNYFNPATRTITPMISPAVHDVIVNNADRFNSAIIYDRDYLYNYFGFKASLLMSLFIGLFGLENERLSNRYRIGTDTGCIVSNHIGYFCIEEKEYSYRYRPLCIFEYLYRIVSVHARIVRSLMWIFSMYVVVASYFPHSAI